jgi:hypothetical protein
LSHTCAYCRPVVSSEFILAQRTLTGNCLAPEMSKTRRWIAIGRVRMFGTTTKIKPSSRVVMEK